MPRPPKAKSVAKDSGANFAWGQRFSHCIPRSLGEGGHLAPQTALRGSAFYQGEALPQVVSVAKNNMVALPGQLFYSTQIPVYLWFLRENGNAIAKRSANKYNEL